MTEPVKIGRDGMWCARKKCNKQGSCMYMHTECKAMTHEQARVKQAEWEAARQARVEEAGRQWENYLANSATVDEKFDAILEALERIQDTKYGPPLMEPIRILKKETRHA